MAEREGLWKRCLATRETVGPAEAWVETLSRVEQSYLDSARIYHDLRHLHRMFDELDRWRPSLDLSIDRLVALELAIVYHDVVYVPGRRDNEIRSAERSVHDLKALGAPRSLYRQVERSVRATIHHVCDRRDTVSCMLIDLDLCAMANETEYLENGDRIRKEFSVYEDEVFLPARAEFLRSFLSRRRLFRGPFAELYERAARENMAADLHRLEARGV